MKSEFSQTIQFARVALKKSQREVGLQVGFHRAVVSKWERGVDFPLPDHLPHLAAALQLTTEMLTDLRLQCRRPRRRQRRRFRLRPYKNRPAYPQGATVDQMRELGEVARRVDDAAKQKLTAEQYARLVNRFPFDTKNELLAIMHTVANDGKRVITTLDRLFCPLLTLKDFDSTNGGHLRQPAILWKGENLFFLIFGQVRVRCGNGKPYRIDFLIYYKKKGSPARWIVYELDGPSHQLTPNQDAARTEAIGLPELRHDNAQTMSYGFFQRFLQDLEKKADLAALWTKDRLRKARIERRTRFREAEQRRQAA